MVLKLFFVSALLAIVLTSPSIAQQPPDSVEAVVKACVAQVRSFQADEIQQPFFKQFDAFYNAATGLVQNNAYRNGDQPPLFQFNKCMASKGMPLGPPKSN